MKTRMYYKKINVDSQFVKNSNGDLAIDIVPPKDEFGKILMHTLLIIQFYKNREGQTEKRGIARYFRTVVVLN